MLKFWYKKQDTTQYIEIKAVADLKGTERLNDLPGIFKFNSDAPKDADNNFLDFLPDDEFAVTNLDCTELVCHGAVLDPDPQFIGFDRPRNKPFFRYRVTCINKDFSTVPIDTVNFTNTDLQTILNYIFDYTDETLGSIDLAKFLLKFDSYNIEAFTIEKKSARDALTDLTDQIDCFWILKYTCYLDSTLNNLVIKRWVEISNKNGISPEIHSTWDGGISTADIRDGRRENLIVENKSLLPFTPTEINPVLKRNFQVMINHLELSGKIFTSGNSTDLYRYDLPAQPSKFDYDLDGYASDIVYVGLAIKDPKDPVKILAGSTTTHIRIPSMFATSIEAGNVAYFKDDSASFFPVLSVNKINTTYTEVIFDTLPFAIVAGHAFEIISNVDIYQDNAEPPLAYDVKGCVKIIQKNQIGKIRFLELSEPPPGITIIVFYKKITDKNRVFRNKESIDKSGLKYKVIALEDDFVLTETELQNLGTKMLTLSPELQFTVESMRDNKKTPIGLNIPIIIDGYLNNNFIGVQNDWEYKGVDPQKLDFYVNTLTFSNMISDPMKFIAALRRQKNASKNIGSKTSDIYKESVSLIEKFFWTITNELTALDPNPTTITTTYFDLKFITVDAYQYYFDIATDSEFTTIIKTAWATIITAAGRTWEQRINLNSPYSGTLYYRVKVMKNGSVVATSNTITFSTSASNDLVIDSNTLIAWNYQEGIGTTINSSNPATISGSISGNTSSIWQSGLLAKDTHSLKLNGTDNFVQTANYSGIITDFTIRRVFRFNTGDKASKSDHILFSRYDTFLSQGDNTAVFILEYNSVNNQISMFLNDVSGSFSNLKYRIPYFIYNLNENQDYIIQVAFKLQDPNNTNLNKIEICVNGVPQTLNYSDDTISNINGLNQVNIPFFDSIYRANNGAIYYSKYSNSRAFFDLRYRSSSEALIDAQNIGLA